MFKIFTLHSSYVLKDCEKKIGKDYSLKDAKPVVCV